MKKKRISLYLLSLLLMLISVGCSSELPSGLSDVYDIATKNVVKKLPATANTTFPQFDNSFVTYDRSVLEDLGEGTELEYRVYKVSAYVDITSSSGTTVRSNFIAEVCCYTDDYNSPEFGEQGIHKGIEDHYYTYILSLE